MGRLRERYGLDVMVAQGKHADAVHEASYTELARGVFLPKTRDSHGARHGYLPPDRCTRFHADSPRALAWSGSSWIRMWPCKVDSTESWRSARVRARRRAETFPTAH